MDACSGVRILCLYGLYGPSPHIDIDNFTSGTSNREPAMDQRNAIAKLKNYVESEGDSIDQLAYRLEHQTLNRILIDLEAAGFTECSAAEVRLLQALCVAGSRLTGLASHLGISKQATSQLLDNLEKKGLIQRVPDPNDRRAKNIRFTEQGETLMEVTIEATLANERNLADTLGEDSFRALKKALEKVTVKTVAQRR